MDASPIIKNYRFSRCFIILSILNYGIDCKILYLSGVSTGEDINFAMPHIISFFYHFSEWLRNYEREQEERTTFTFFPAEKKVMNSVVNHENDLPMQ